MNRDRKGAIGMIPSRDPKGAIVRLSELFEL